MKVKDCMSKGVVSVKRGTPLREIINIFKDKNFHTLPVIGENSILIGIVNFEDILKVFEPYSSDLQEMLKAIPFIDSPEEERLLETDISSEMGILIVADDIMSTEMVTINPEEDISRAYSLMKLHKTDRLLVTENDNLIGIITLFDIILYLFKDKGVI